jgi:hypothetical protein
MPRNINVTLEWILRIKPDDVPNNAGIYMVVSKFETSKGTTWKILDVGQSGESGPRLSSHDRKDCWDKKKLSISGLLYYFAPMSSYEYDVTDRRIVECCLRANTTPPCGEECNKGYNYEDTVKITNTGIFYPLSASYACSKTS